MRKKKRKKERMNERKKERMKERNKEIKKERKKERNKGLLETKLCISEQFIRFSTYFSINYSLKLSTLLFFVIDIE